MPKRPNVIVFFTDQQRWDSMGLHGNPLDLTPNLDRLARNGTHLANCFTCQPVCGPARSCWQSGRYATRTGCHTNGRPFPDLDDSLARCFDAAGYDTGYIGKWHLGSSRHGAVPEHERAGYRNWLASNVLEFTSDAYRTRMWNEREEAVDLPGYRVDACTDAAIRFVSEPREDPYFLFLSFLEPHHQNHRDDYPAPVGYEERYRSRWTPPDLAALGGSSQRHLAGYWGMIKRLDEALGRLCDALISLDQFDDTVILFTSDHGCHFKTRNGEYKRSCHDSSLRVPGVIHGPGFEHGGERRELVSLIDLPPTLLDAAGIDVPETYDGRSLLRRIRDPDSEWPDEHFAQISEAECGRTIRTERWKYHVRAEGVPGKEAWSDTFTECSLYDLYSDPYELENLVGKDSHRALCDELKERLLARMEQAGEQRPAILDAEAQSSGQRTVDGEEPRSGGHWVLVSGNG